MDPSEKFYFRSKRGNVSLHFACLKPHRAVVTKQHQCRATNSVLLVADAGEDARYQVCSLGVFEGEKIYVAGRQALIAVRLVLIVSKFPRFEMNA